MGWCCKGDAALGHAFEPLSYQVWGACIEVQRQLGPHCMEVDYQRALELALAKRGLAFMREAEIPIVFDGVVVTRRRVDFVIWDAEATLILEIKAAKAIRPEDHEQCLLYLRNGNFRVCLLANFGETPLGKARKVHSPNAPALYGPHP
jgi:GxxExxY protein